MPIQAPRRHATRDIRRKDSKAGAARADELNFLSIISFPFSVFPFFFDQCSARVWDAITGAELEHFPHKHIVRTVEFAPDSRRFVSGGNEGKLRVYDLMEPSAPPMTMDLPKSGTTFSKAVWDQSDPQRVLTGSSDGKVRAWDLRARKETQVAEVQGRKKKELSFGWVGEENGCYAWRLLFGRDSAP